MGNFLLATFFCFSRASRPGVVFFVIEYTVAALVARRRRAIFTAHGRNIARLIGDDIEYDPIYGILRKRAISVNFLPVFSPGE